MKNISAKGLLVLTSKWTLNNILHLISHVPEILHLTENVIRYAKMPPLIEISFAVERFCFVQSAKNQPANTKLSFCFGRQDASSQVCPKRNRRRGSFAPSSDASAKSTNHRITEIFTPIICFIVQCACDPK